MFVCVCGRFLSLNSSNILLVFFIKNCPWNIPSGIIQVHCINSSKWRTKAFRHVHVLKDRGRTTDCVLACHWLFNGHFSVHFVYWLTQQSSLTEYKNQHYKLSLRNTIQCSFLIALTYIASSTVICMYNKPKWIWFQGTYEYE